MCHESSKGKQMILFKVCSSQLDVSSGWPRASRISTWSLFASLLPTWDSQVVLNMYKNQSINVYHPTANKFDFQTSVTNFRLHIFDDGNCDGEILYCLPSIL